MTGCDRVLTALQLKTPDRVPHFEIGLDRNVKRLINPGRYRVADYFDWDAVLVDDRSLPGYRVEYVDSKDTIFRDQWGVTRQLTSELIAHPVKPAFETAEEVKTWQPPDPDETWRYEKLIELVKEYKGKKAVIATFADPFDVANDVRGANNHFTDFHRNPDLIDILAEKITLYYQKYIRNCIKVGVDIILIAGDYATTRGPMVSPEKCRQHLIPCLKALVDETHRGGIYVVKHTDGNIMPIIEMIIGTGINGLHPIDPNAGMDLGQVKKKYGKKVCLLGNVDCSYVLSWGSVQEVREDVKRCMRQAAYNGGFICMSSNTIHSAVKPENYVEMVKAIHEYGKYPIVL